MGRYVNLSFHNRCNYSIHAHNTFKLINANELRIGNWVDHDSIICRIEEITDNGFSLRPVIEFGGRFVLVKKNFIFPIPLTPEIVESCGFEKKENSFRILTNRPKYNYTKNEVEIGEYFFENETPNCQWGCSSSFAKPFRYVHQLQNLYFALTGEELKINLNVEALQR